MNQIFLFISIAVIGAGFYLNLFYDVPDSEAKINFFTSWFLIIIGVSSLLVNIFWTENKKKTRNKDND